MIRNSPSTAGCSAIASRWRSSCRGATRASPGQDSGVGFDATHKRRWRTNPTTQGGIARDQDRRGNLLSTVQTAETLLYSWDDESQLTSVRLDPPSSPVIQPWRIDFEYDGLRRLRRVLQYTWNGWAWTSQGETRYLYDGGFA